MNTNVKMSKNNTSAKALKYVICMAVTMVAALVLLSAAA